MRRIAIPAQDFAVATTCGGILTQRALNRALLARQLLLQGLHA